MFTKILRLLFFIALACSAAYLVYITFAFGKGRFEAFLYGFIGILFTGIGIYQARKTYLLIHHGKKCYVCNGTGYVSVKKAYYGYTPDYDGNPIRSMPVKEGYTSVREKCSKCNGTGRLY